MGGTTTLIWSSARAKVLASSSWVREGIWELMWIATRSLPGTTRPAIPSMGEHATLG